MSDDDVDRPIAIKDPARLGHLKKYLLIGLERKRLREAAEAKAAGERAS